MGLLYATVKAVSAKIHTYLPCLRSAASLKKLSVVLKCLISPYWNWKFRGYGRTGPQKANTSHRKKRCAVTCKCITTKRKVQNQRIQLNEMLRNRWKKLDYDSIRLEITVQHSSILLRKTWQLGSFVRGLEGRKIRLISEPILTKGQSRQRDFVLTKLQQFQK